MLVKVALYLGIFAAGFILVSLLSLFLVVRPPRIRSTATPAQFALPYEPLTLTAADGTSLAAWLISRGGPTERLAPAILLLHGYPADKGDLLPIARTLADEFDLLLLDLRYFGQSAGRYTTLGAKERLDVRAALDLLAARGYGPIGVFGFSLGGVVGILAAAQDPRIRAIVAYAPYADLTLLGQESYRHLWVLATPLVALMKLWTRWLLGLDADTLAPHRAAGRLRIPVLIVHGQQDDQIPIRHARIYQQALGQNPHAAFYFPERLFHGDLPPDFTQQVRTFFRRHLVPGPLGKSPPAP